MPELSEKKLWNYAVWLLARRNYHSAALREKLVRKGTGTPEQIELIIARLKKAHYINDEEYLRYYINDQLMLRPQGMRMIRQRLRKKGIKGESVEQELAKYQDRETDYAKQALAKKLKTLKAGSERERRQKLFRFLLSRGFNIDTVKEALNK